MRICSACRTGEVRNLHDAEVGGLQHLVALAVVDEEPGLAPGDHDAGEAGGEDVLRAGGRTGPALAAWFERAVDRAALQPLRRGGLGERGLLRVDVKPPSRVWPRAISSPLRSTMTAPTLKAPRRARFQILKIYISQVSKIRGEGPGCFARQLSTALSDTLNIPRCLRGRAPRPTRPLPAFTRLPVWMATSALHSSPVHLRGDQ